VRYGNRGQITVRNISYIYLLRERASFRGNMLGFIIVRYD